MVKTLAFLVLLFCGFAYPARSLDPAVFTKEAGLVPGSIGPGLDCWDLLPLLLGTDCAWPSVNEQSIEVTVCVLSPDSGALVITSPDRGASFTASPGQVGTSTGQVYQAVAAPSSGLEPFHAAGRISREARWPGDKSSRGPLLLTSTCNCSLPHRHHRSRPRRGLVSHQL